MSGDDASFLTILLDTTPGFWAHVESQCHLTAKAFLEQLFIFLRTYTLLNDDNQLAIFATRPSATTLLFATENCSQHVAAEHRAGAGDAVQQIHDRLTSILADDAAEAHEAPRRESLFSNSLSRALCFINKVRSSAPERQHLPQPRVLCVCAGPDVTSQYIAVMNAIFAAQRNDVIIDGLKLGEQHSGFLQQAAHLTGGVYQRPTKPTALVQYLLSTYTAAAGTRQFLRLPKTTSVDFRASCFCHKRPIDTGFVCSVCLSIYCDSVPTCTTCQTTFSGGAVQKS